MFSFVNKPLITFCCSVFIIIGLVLVRPLQAENSPVPIANGKITNLSKQNWNFYWRKFILPDEFKQKNPTPSIRLKQVRPWHKLKIDGKPLGSFGYATYRLVINVNYRGQMGLFVPAPFASYKLYINGRLMSQAGKPRVLAGLDGNQELIKAGDHKRLSKVVYFYQETDRLELVLHVANYLHSKGGMRGSLWLGEAGELRRMYERRMGLDFFGLGVIGAILLYHLYLLLLRGYRSTNLAFVFLALVYFLVALMYGSQTISTFIPQLPFHIHLHIGSFLIYLCTPFFVNFFDAMYPGIISRYLIIYFRVMAGIFLCMLFFPVHWFNQANQIYYLACGLTGILTGIYVSVRALLAGRPGSGMLLAGSLAFLVFAAYAIYLTQNDFIAGSMATTGFAIFAIFQAGALAREHASLEEMNKKMTRRILDDRAALAQQRRELEANLHDNLGGRLTDLKLATKNLVSGNLLPNTEKYLNDMGKSIDETIASFRTQLLFFEDIEIVMNDFFGGLHMILLRRYSSADKEFKFVVEDNAQDLISGEGVGDNLSDASKLDLILVVQEICTNSLKYGKGDYSWNFSTDKGGLLISAQSSTTNRLVGRTGKGRRTIEMRLKRLNGTIEQSNANSLYEVKVHVPWNGLS